MADLKYLCNSTETHVFELSLLNPSKKVETQYNDALTLRRKGGGHRHQDRRGYDDDDSDLLVCQHSGFFSICLILVGLIKFILLFDKKGTKMYVKVRHIIYTF